MRLEILAPGWDVSPAHADEFEQLDATSKVGEKSFRWERWNIPALFLSGRSALLLLQGMKLQKLFDNAGLIVSGRSGFYSGPYTLIKGDYLSYNVPPRLTGVVLARPYDIGPLSKEEVLGAIVQDVLAP